MTKQEMRFGFFFAALMLLEVVLPVALAQDVGSVPGIQLQNGGTSQGQVTKLNCTGSASCSRSGSTGTINVTSSPGGGGAPVDAGYVVISGFSSGSTNERALSNGTNTTIDTATAGVIKVNLSGTIAAANGGLGAAQPTCAVGDVLTCNGTTCTCTTPTGSGMTSDQALSRASLVP